MARLLVTQLCGVTWQHCSIHFNAAGLRHIHSCDQTLSLELLWQLREVNLHARERLVEHANLHTWHLLRDPDQLCDLNANDDVPRGAKPS